MKKIAIIGSGISGLTAAYCLSEERNHTLAVVDRRKAVDITVYESESRIGGHTATIDVEEDGRQLAIDTGFIVYNDWTYPKFIRLLELINVATRPTSMSFSVRCDQTGLEYAGSNLNTLFAQRRNIASPKYWNMLRDILRFNKESIEDFEQGQLDDGLSLGEYLKNNHYGQMFIDKYLFPMAAAIWSSSTQSIEHFPALFFVRFFKNHGLLSVKNRPQWHTIVGGSKSYLKPLTKSFASNIRLNTKIESIKREEDRVLVRHKDGSLEQYHGLIFATHSDQALALLDDASDLEKEILGALPYKANDVVLHTDTSLLPRRPLAWSCWNYRITDEKDGSSESSSAKLTYDMNLLQGFNTKHTYCVSLNQTDEIRQEKIIGQYSYAHPMFTLPGIEAQKRAGEINGVNRTWYCGAYWRNGFHEDGVVSALKVIKDMDAGFLAQ